MKRSRTRSYRVKIGDSWGFVRGQLGDPCSCGCVGAALCDYPVGEGKTCDRILCRDTPCGHHVGPDIDYCRDHYQEWLEFEKSGGVKEVLENVVPFKCP